jgi:hypothetical protein
MFKLKKINKAEGKEKYHVEVSNGFAALEDLDITNSLCGAEYHSIGHKIAATR